MSTNIQSLKYNTSLGVDKRLKDIDWEKRCLLVVKLQV